MKYNLFINKKINNIFDSIITLSNGNNFIQLPYALLTKEIIEVYPLFKKIEMKNNFEKNIIMQDYTIYQYMLNKKILLPIIVQTDIKQEILISYFDLNHLIIKNSKLYVELDSNIYVKPGMLVRYKSIYVGTKKLSTLDQYLYTIIYKEIIERIKEGKEDFILFPRLITLTRNEKELFMFNEKTIIDSLEHMRGMDLIDIQEYNHSITYAKIYLR
jgi:hypothetical protein